MLIHIEIFNAGDQVTGSREQGAGSRYQVTGSRGRARACQISLDETARSA